MVNIVHGEEAATSKQTFLIFRLGGGDVRGQNLTRQQASDMIEQLMSAKGVSHLSRPKETKTPKVKAKTEDQHFADIIAEATQAANDAGDKWMANARPQFRVVERANPFDDNSPVVKDWGTMLDVCGFSYVEIGDKRTKFAKYLMKQQNSTHAVRLNHKYTMRQELGLAEAIARAELEVFRKHGVEKGLRFYSRID